MTSSNTMVQLLTYTTIQRLYEDVELFIGANLSKHDENGMYSK